jgi:DNA-binding FadR family transcriptional regulator
MAYNLANSPTGQANCVFPNLIGLRRSLVLPPRKYSVQIEAVRVRRLYLQVAEQLSNLIQQGNLSAGERLPSERDLAAKFQVSRPTIREAMIALEIAGMVEIRSGSGVYVMAASIQPALHSEEVPGPLEVLEARKAIEGETAALAAQHSSPELISALEQELKIMADATTSIEEKEAADQCFHQLIAAASGNSALHTTVNWLWQLRMESTISQSFHERLRKEGSTPLVVDHQAVLQAIADGDSNAARAAMHNHIQRVLDTILE